MTTKLSAVRLFGRAYALAALVRRFAAARLDRVVVAGGVGRITVILHAAGLGLTAGARAGT